MRYWLASLLALSVLVACHTIRKQGSIAGREPSAEASYSDYCIANDATGVPRPNDSNDLVSGARKKFKYMSLNSIYLYPPVMAAYGLKKAENTDELGQNFLVYLCGEFRDRPGLIRAKLLWIQNMNKLQDKPVAGIDTTKNVWTQISARAYVPYLLISRQLFDLRQAKLAGNKYKFGGSNNVDSPVPGMTVCETKYIFDRMIPGNQQLGTQGVEPDPQADIGSAGSYDTLAAQIREFEAHIKKQKEQKQAAYDTWKAYKQSTGKNDLSLQDKFMALNEDVEANEAALEKMKAKLATMKAKPAAPSSPAPQDPVDRFNENVRKYAASGKCSTDDLVDYYDFRGDSNFKPNSPESNGMIWYTLYVASNCRNLKSAAAPSASAQGKPTMVDDEVCRSYFERPFSTRWNAARAGLATWMLYDKKHSEKFADDSHQQVVVYPHKFTSPDWQRPFSYGFAQGGEQLNKYIVSGQNAMQANDLLFNSAAGMGTSKGAEFAYQRLRDAVNRHTNWYKSAWDDQLGGAKSFRDQAYSPLVASSYEMSESDNFTACGITVPCPPDGFKHWMFVFRVKGGNWYTTKSLAENKPIDFAKMWFDETSFGTTGLAKKERAWDRLGTAMEDELEGGAILYLHNITAEGEVSNDGNN